MRRHMLLILMVAVAVWPPRSVYATDVPAVDFTTSTWGTIPRTDTLGYEFTALDPVEVTMLGFFHPGTMVGTTSVGLWTSSGSMLLASAIVGEPGREGQWVWQSITPVTLEAGKNYIVGGWVSSTSMPVYGDYNPPNWTEDPRIAFVWPRSSSSVSFSFPDVPSGPSFYYGNFGGNMKLKGPDPVPEPAFVQLPFLLAMGVACAWRRRSR